MLYVLNIYTLYIRFFLVDNFFLLIFLKMNLDNNYSFIKKTKLLYYVVLCICIVNLVLKQILIYKITKIKIFKYFFFVLIGNLRSRAILFIYKCQYN